MTVSPSIRAAARSAYRHLLRASASTFAGTSVWLSYPLQANSSPGDAPIQKGNLLTWPAFTILIFSIAFRIQMRTNTLALDSVAQNDSSQVEEKIQLAKDLAATLRKNVVQARRVETSSGEEAWSGFRIK